MRARVVVVWWVVVEGDVSKRAVCVFKKKKVGKASAQDTYTHIYIHTHTVERT